MKEENSSCPIRARLREYRSLDIDSKQGVIVSMLRECLLITNMIVPEDEILLGMWLECLGVGMDDLLTIVAAQTILSERSLSSMEELVVEPGKLLNSSLLLQQKDSLVFMRIYLHVLRRVIWSSKKRHTTLANASGPYPDLNILAAFVQVEKSIVKFLLRLIPECYNQKCKRIIVSFIHQMFLENSSLIKFTHTEGYPVQLIPWLVEYAPSTHILLETVQGDIQALREPNFFKLKLGGNLALKYPLPKTLELCEVILEKCEVFGALLVEDALECLEVTLLVLRAFPILMSKVAPLLVQWSNKYNGNSAFTSATVMAAGLIGEINSAVRAPIYRKRHQLILD